MSRYVLNKYLVALCESGAVCGQKVGVTGVTRSVCLFVDNKSGFKDSRQWGVQPFLKGPTDLTYIQ